MLIERNIYLDRLIRAKNNGLIKIVTGIRRCGKSYLLFELFHRHLHSEGVPDDHIIEIQLDAMENRRLRDPETIYAEITRRIHDAGQYYIILDEIQMLDDFVDVLNGLLHIRNADIYVTGSNSHFLSSDVATEFRGRGIEIHMLPLSFAEFMQHYDGTPGEGWDEYCTYGGLPQLAALPDPQDKEQYLQSVFTNVYLSDVLDRNRLRNPEELSELVDVLASSIGSLTNPTKLSNTFRSVKGVSLSAPTITRYIGYLEDAFLVKQARRYDTKGRRYIGSPFKYYFEDVGLRNSRLDFRQTEINHIMENVLYNDLRTRGFRVDVGSVPVYAHAANGTTQRRNYEVAFIASKGNQKIYLQSAYRLNTPEKLEQEENSLRNLNDSFPKIIVVENDHKARLDANGFLVVGVRQFLLDPDILDR